MEWSEPRDAWDDAGDDVPADAAAYPPAPVPAHERTWRHPSERGQEMWKLSEPPVAIGRGLLVTTGAIGSVLGIAVLWLLVPIGGGLAPSAAPTVTSTFAARFGSSVSTTRVEAAPDETTSSVVADEPTTAPADVRTVNTVLVESPVAAASPSVAVAIGELPYVITTAAAVDGTDGVHLVAVGSSIEGAVMAVEGDLAFIQPSAPIDVLAFSEVAAAAVGDTVTVLTDESEVEVAWSDDGDVPDLDPTIVVEGTPVVDGDGALVALCTLVIDADGATVHLVPVGSPDAAPPTTDTPVSTSSTVAPTSTSTTVAATTSTDGGQPAVTTPATAAWIGIRLGGVDGADRLTITSVATGSPAELAGLSVGDRVVAVDGSMVTTADEIVAALAGKAPGDAMAITLRSAGSNGQAEVERTVSVVLGAYEPTV